MAPFYPIFVRRSDGKLEIKKSKSSIETNEPSPDQLNERPNAQGVADFYRLCPQGELKDLDWRRKIGGMLMRELDEKSSTGE